jgi:hypothetical protein
MKKFSDFLPLNKREFKGMENNAFRYLERRYSKTQNLQEVMKDALAAVQDSLSKEEFSLMEKAAKALDLALFIQFFAKGLTQPERV